MGRGKDTAKALGKAALAAGAVAAPEVAIPVELAGRAFQALGRARKVSGPHPTQTNAPQSPGALPVVLPQPPLLVVRKGRLRKMRKGGQSVLIYEPARGLTAGETALVMALGLGAYGAYKAAEWVKTEAGTLAPKVPKLPWPL